MSNHHNGNDDDDDDDDDDNNISDNPDCHSLSHRFVCQCHTHGSCGFVWTQCTLPISFDGWSWFSICAMVKRRYERLQLRSAITTQNMWFTVCSDRGPCVAIPLFRLCLWLNLPVGRMTFQSFDVRVRHWSSRSGLVFLGSCKMACRQVYMR
jgi:hypothetical protein